MASPFGLAYGIGAGLSGVLPAYQAGQDASIVRSMKALQLSEAQRKADEQRSLEAALAQPTTPTKPITYTTPGITEEQYNEMAQHDVPEGEEGPNQTYGQQIAQTRTVTPYQSVAGERAAMLKKAAETQRSRGFGLSAAQLMTQAQAADKEHQSASALELIRAAKFGDSDRMMSAIHALGGVHARDVRPNGEGGVTLTAGDGNEVDLDKGDLRAIATGSDPAEIFSQKAALTQKNKLEQMNKKAETDQLLLQQRIQANKEKLQQSFENEKELLPLKERIRQATGRNVDSAMMKNVRFLAETRMNQSAEQGIEMSPAQAMADAADMVAGANRGRVTEADTFRAAVADRRALLRDNPNASKPGNKDYATWKALTDQIASLTRPGSQMPRVGYVQPQAQPASSGFTVVTDASGRVIKSNDPKQPIGSTPKVGGKLVPNRTFNY